MKLTFKDRNTNSNEFDTKLLFLTFSFKKTNLSVHEIFFTQCVFTLFNIIFWPFFIAWVVRLLGIKFQINTFNDWFGINLALIVVGHFTGKNK